jgi:hypothetical protein
MGNSYVVFLVSSTVFWNIFPPCCSVLWWPPWSHSCIRQYLCDFLNPAWWYKWHHPNNSHHFFCSLILSSDKAEPQLTLKVSSNFCVVSPNITHKYLELNPSDFLIIWCPASIFLLSLSVLPMLTGYCWVFCIRPCWGFSGYKWAQRLLMYMVGTTVLPRHSEHQIQEPYRLWRNVPFPNMCHLCSVGHIIM